MLGRLAAVVGRGDPQVVAGDADAAGQPAVLDVGPVIDAGVPGVGRLAEEGGLAGLALPLGHLGGDEQGGDQAPEGVGVVAALVLPALLLGRGAAADDVGGRLADHGPAGGELGVVQGALAVEQVGQQGRHRRLAELDARPEGLAAGPHVLGPVAIVLLRVAEEAEGAAGLVAGPGRQQPAGDLGQVSRPDHVIAPPAGALPLVAEGRAPGDREAGDDRARDRLALVDAQDHRAGPVQVAPPGLGLLQGEQRPLPGLPVADVLGDEGVEVIPDAGQGAVAGLAGVDAEAQGQDELPPGGAEIHLAGQEHVAARGEVVAAGHPAVPHHVAAAVAHGADVAGRAGRPIGRGGQGQRRHRPSRRRASSGPCGARPTRRRRRPCAGRGGGSRSHRGDNPPATLAGA